jgi:hypothetical protein
MADGIERVDAARKSQPDRQGSRSLPGGKSLWADVLDEREIAVVGFSFCRQPASCWPPGSAVGRRTPRRSNASEDIVVTGDPWMRQTGFDLSRRYGDDPDRPARPLGNEPVCVEDLGAAARAERPYLQITTWMSAERIGARTDRSELCRPNVRIGFTDDPQGAIQTVARRAPLVLGFHYASQHRRLTRIRFPIQAWYATMTGGTDGDGLLDAVGYETAGGRAGSRLSADIASSFVHVLVLADRRIAVGREAAEVADLIALLALAQSAPAEICDPAGTILNLFNEDCAPGQRDRALTPRDLAYLDALSHVTPTLGPALQRGAMAVQMGRDLADE